MKTTLASRARRLLAMAERAKINTESHLTIMSPHADNPQIKEVCERKQGYVEMLDAVIAALNGDFTLMSIYTNEN